VTDLATSDDVATALGLADSTELTASQAARVDTLLARVSAAFVAEAGRPFTPGTDTVRLLCVAGRVRLPEPVSVVGDVSSVTFEYSGDTTDVDYTLYGTRELVCEYRNVAITTGTYVTVTYTHSGAVPAAVVADVAAIVARLLTVEPSEGKVLSESAGPFSVRYADWSAASTLLTRDELATARSYRVSPVSVVVHKP